MRTQGKWEIEKRDGHSAYGVRPVITSKKLPADGRIAIISYRGVPSIKEADANAEHICRCVNSHDDLMGLLSNVLNGVDIDLDATQRLFDKIAGK